MNIVHSNCDPELANDRSLPCIAYLVEFDNGNGVVYDIVISGKKSEIFDYYWDKYREDFKPPWYQSEGRINPKLWTPPKEKKKK